MASRDVVRDRVWVRMFGVEGTMLRAGHYAARENELPAAHESWWSKDQIVEALRRHAKEDDPPTKAEWADPPYDEARDWVAEMVREGRLVQDDELQRHLYHPDFVTRPITAVVEAVFRREAESSTLGPWSYAAKAAGLSYRRQGQSRGRSTPSEKPPGTNRRMVTGGA